MSNKKPQYWIHAIERQAHYIGKGRLIRLGLATLMIVSLFIPVLQQISTEQRYSLNPGMIRLVGATNKNLARKLTYDTQTAQWQFNKDGIKSPDAQPTANPLAALKAQIGGAGKQDTSLYSVDLPTDGTKGVTYYDNNTDLSFGVVPEFAVSAGQARDGKLIYPITGDAKIVYTAKNNGMKEDIVLPHNIGNTLQFRYKLNLPDTLQAKILDDGSVGIYSADPSLFGNITFGANSDREKIESARQTAVKDHLLFAIPAPVIKQTGSKTMQAAAQFSLDGSELVLYAGNMNSLTYPATVDPSVVVTSSSDFASGNNEGNIDFGTADQINRGAVTGGTISGGWTATTSTTNNYSDTQPVIAGGRAYLVGSAHTEYAAFNSNGTLGAWASTTVLPAALSRGCVSAYNNHLYYSGGYNGSSAVNTVYDAPVNADGTLGAWTATAALPSARYYQGCGVYQNYIYTTGGTGAADLSEVDYAPMKADGTLGAWATTTSMPATRTEHTTVIYNGYIYALVGRSGGTSTNDALYAPLNANGTVGAWMTTTGPTTTIYSNGLQDQAGTVNNGYVYLFGGKDDPRTGSVYSTVSYARLNANGTTGTWYTTVSGYTSSSGTGVTALATAYNGYLYEFGGGVGTGVQYAKLDPAGVTSSYKTTTSLLSETTGGKTYSTRRDLGAVAYNGYVYVLGGYTATPAAHYYNSVIYAPINADGTLGAWTATTSFTTARTALATVAYNGYMYVMGGWNGTTYYSDVQYAPINSNGTLGTWTTVTASPLPSGRDGLSVVAYNGYLYALGGNASTGALSDVLYAAINSNGTIGAWASANTGTTFSARSGLTAMVGSGYMYIAGGGSGSLMDVQYAPINSNGTVGSWTATTAYGAGGAALDGTDQAVIYDGYMYVAGEGPNSLKMGMINANGTISSWTLLSAAPAWRSSFGFVQANGYLYAMGGWDGISMYATAEEMKINNGGIGTVNAWTATTSFTTARMGHSTVAYNGYLYVLGGLNGTTYYNDVQYAPINPNGTIGTWATTTAFTTARELQTAVIANGYLYILGGYNGGYLSDVQYAPINANGTIGTWATTSAFPTGRRAQTSVVNNGYIYALGGASSTGTLTAVLYAPINTNGTIGAWATTTVLSVARESASSVAYDGYLYVLGGSISGAASVSVQYAPINSNGTIGTWTDTTQLATARQDHASVVSNGYLYVMGGTASTDLNDVQYAPVNSNGTLGRWATTSAFTTGRYYLDAVMYNGYMYVLGGNSTTTATYYSDVQYAPINVSARTGHYSKLINFGATVSLSGFTYNGIVPGGGKSISYMSAGTDGVFGPAATIDSLSGTGTGGTCGTGGGGGGSQYVWINVTLDDSLAGGVYADGAGTQNADLTDITVNYAGAGQHPVPNVRLRGGKYFNTEALQPLDTCGP